MINWTEIAYHFIQLLQKYDNEHETYFSYYLNQEEASSEEIFAIGQLLQEAVENEQER